MDRTARSNLSRSAPISSPNPHFQPKFGMALRWPRIACASACVLPSSSQAHALAAEGEELTRSTYLFALAMGNRWFLPTATTTRRAPHLAAAVVSSMCRHNDHLPHHAPSCSCKLSQPLPCPDVHLPHWWHLNQAPCVGHLDEPPEPACNREILQRRAFLLPDLHRGFIVVGAVLQG
jgi:hypothetical protein